jgi:hypothetical protein
MVPPRVGLIDIYPAVELVVVLVAPKDYIECISIL